MQFNAFCEGMRALPQQPAHAMTRKQSGCIRSSTRALSRLLFSVLLMMVAFSPVSAETPEPRITLSKKNSTLQEVFKDIQKQTSYAFVYNTEMMQQTKRVTINVKDASLEAVLSLCFRDQPLTYSIVDKIIVVQKKEKVVETPERDTAQSPDFPSLMNVKGKVTDEKLNPVAKATVLVKGTRKMTATDNNGEFTIDEVAANSVLVFTCVGFTPKEIPIRGNPNISAQLKVAVGNLDETVVVAYNTTTSRANTAAVTVVKGDQIANLPNRSFDKSLQGLVPGLLVTSGTGQPGGGVANFVMRGIATASDVVYNSTIRNPLIVIDGVPVTQEGYQWASSLEETPVINPIAQLNPSDIETISILKDAAAIALYGSKASNGVILVTTKKGKAGKTVIGFRHQTDIAQRLPGKLKLANQDEYLELLYETFRNSGFGNRDSLRSELYKQFPVRIHNGDTSFYPATNWEDEIYTNRAFTVSNELSISGGNEKTLFYMNLEYTKQNGVVKKTGFDRKSLRFNLDNRPTSWLKLGLNSTLSYSIQDYASLVGGDLPYGVASLTSPLNPVRLEDGNYLWNFTTPFFAANPAAQLEFNKNRNTSYRGLTKASAEVSFLKSFKLTTSLGADFMYLETKEKSDLRLYDSYTTSVGSGRIQERNSRYANLITTNTLAYDKTFSYDHNINVLLGQEAQILTTRFLEVIGTGFKIPTNDDISNAAQKTSSGLSTKQTLISYFGQLNYAFKNKYFLSSSIRKDGSSLFGERNRFGSYWSLGGGWIASSESFMNGTSSWLDYLKFRGSLGVAGNSFVIDRYTRYDLLQVSRYLGNLAVYNGRLGNPNIRWEKTFNWDVGVEARFWKQRISFTADIYKRKTSDVIFDINLPYTSGFTRVKDNIGDIENRGIELSLSIDIIKNRDFRWNLNANWSTNKNILVKANIPEFSSVDNLQNRVGKNFNSFYLVPWAGVNPDNGNPQYLDSAGKITSDFPVGKQNERYFGKPQPDGFGAVINSFNFKNIQLTATFYYQYGFQVNTSMMVNDGANPLMNQDKSALDRWQKPGDIATNPKRFIYNYTSNGSRYIYNGDFIRLQDLSVSYDLPKKIVNRLGLTTLKVYAKAYNLAIWTHYPGSDVANTNVHGTNGFSYPNQKSYSLGFNLNF